MKFKFLKVATIAVVLCASAIAAVAHAALITDLSERDWRTEGDKALTYDRSTGLEWLDLSVTMGNSIADTENESFFDDFRWATPKEIENILDVVLMGDDSRSSDRYLAIRNARTFIYLFGPHAVVPHRYTLGGITRLFTPPPFGYDFRPSTSERSGYVKIGLGNYDEPFAIVSDPFRSSHTTDRFGFPNVGSWLIYTGSPYQPSINVPEPSTLAIFALGMIGLVTRRFKKQS